jgi:hypothetical protein
MDRFALEVSRTFRHGPSIFGERKETPKASKSLGLMALVGGSFQQFGYLLHASLSSIPRRGYPLLLAARRDGSDGAAYPSTTVPLKSHRRRF